MRKEKQVFLLLFLSCFQGVSQNDSVYLDPRDTIIQTGTLNNQSLSADRSTNADKKKNVYTLQPIVDISIVAVGSIWSGYAFTKIYKKTPPTVAEINNLKTGDINTFDRWAVYPYSKTLDKISYYPFYASIPIPLVFFLAGENTRSDFFKLSFLYWEAMSITGLLGTGATYNIDRYRPYAYSTETPMEKRTGSIAKNSFYAGHVQVVATPTFFMAKVYADYYPDSRIKWVFYGIASLATGTTAWMRLRGGEHFPTDVLLGTATGALAGILVPQYHKTHSSINSDLSIMPYSSGNINGMVLTYKFRNRCLLNSK